MTDDVANLESTVRTLLAIAGLDLSDAEVATLTRAYTAYREAVDSLYAIPEARYETPSLVFNPTSPPAPWQAIALKGARDA